MQGMIEVSLHEAETHLTEILEKALHGEDVVISRGLGGAVRLVPVENPKMEDYRQNEALASADNREFNHYMG